jgi:hypothetical protein
MSAYDDSINEDYAGGNLFEELLKHVGTTVTIYTTSGGESGCGVTGVLTKVTPCTVRIVTCLGPAPCCALGSPCKTRCCPPFRRGCNFDGFVFNVGSVAEIPLDRIAFFVHNAV